MNIEEIEAAYRVLGLEPGAPEKEVKEAFKHHVQAFHPDRFQAGSSGQKWASEMLVKVNQSNDVLKAFFKESPSGEPAGGWSKKKTDQSEEASGAADHGDSMDWQSWRKSREDDLVDDLAHWMSARETQDAGRQKQQGREQRKTQLSLVKYFSMVIVVALFLGRGCSGASTQQMFATEIGLWQIRYSAVLQADDTIVYQPGTSEWEKKQAKEELDKIGATYQGKVIERQVGQALFFAFVGAWIWIFFFRRPKVVMDNWIETGIFSLNDLGTAAKDAAVEMKKTAQNAAIKVKPAVDAGAACAKAAAEAFKTRAQEAAEKVKPGVDEGAGAAKVASADIVAKAKKAADDLKERNKRPEGKPAHTDSNVEDRAKAMYEEALKKAHEKNEAEKASKKPSDADIKAAYERIAANEKAAKEAKKAKDKKNSG